MDDDKVAFGHDHARLVLEGPGSTLYEVEETFVARLDMGTVLDAVPPASQSTQPYWDDLKSFVSEGMF
jgi:hypothetical protein